MTSIEPVQMDLFSCVPDGSREHHDPQSRDHPRETLRRLLSDDLEFHGEDTGYATHNFHAFPAKFPPQLPRKFISYLTQPGEIVLDPMAGSGTTVVEAMILGRYGIGVDIDPLAISLASVKTTPIDPGEIIRIARPIFQNAIAALHHERNTLREAFEAYFDSDTKKFIDYWFREDTQLELFCIAREIKAISDATLRRFFQIALSSIIITKSGGVSMAYDLAHTRPHKKEGKIPRSAIEEFQKRLNKNVKTIAKLNNLKGKGTILCSDAQAVSLRDDSIDLIVTSPPYASNAIDYMRAHKFSLVWFGYNIGSLSKKRSDYIGGERIRNSPAYALPEYTEYIISQLGDRDLKKAHVLRRYYSEMYLCLSEMYRVLKPKRTAVVVVGSSTMRGVNIEAGRCLAEIGQNGGFDLVGIGQRRLDRDRRMMPAGIGGNSRSRIEERMHKEYVLGFCKLK
ncbi:MAG: hypothetical protein DRG76_02855 [Deltaproteobacteria bacterium]|nr:MAG: hypothetical protein DRG76_02855 [Deltaproteobacteria bacterium]